MARAKTYVRDVRISDACTLGILRWILSKRLKKIMTWKAEPKIDQFQKNTKEFALQDGIYQRLKI